LRNASRAGVSTKIAPRIELELRLAALESAMRERS